MLFAGGGTQVYSAPVVCRQFELTAYIPATPSPTSPCRPRCSQEVFKPDSLMMTYLRWTGTYCSNLIGMCMAALAARGMRPCRAGTWSPSPEQTLARPYAAIRRPEVCYSRDPGRPSCSSR
ncbi:hypothetical protein FA95DRAFT_1162869 [Auriscalpium vulgare]|uniref:Uncharacterized protein n=1 Tax=Auriscalpium vulgare TaxID=40419 RepID=A0ACB8S9H8_9AGAM|nr:hypothetical protein FA95DRAFT_1162869 [Auriscalpium vulgare]